MNQDKITELQEAQLKAAAIVNMLYEYVDNEDSTSMDCKDTIVGAVWQLKDLILSQKDKIQALVQ